MKIAQTRDGNQTQEPMSGKQPKKIAIVIVKYFKV